MSDLSDLSGRRLGQYEISGILGQGGMATVYRAFQKSMDREVAIKVITSALANNPDFVLRFEREIRVLAKLQHPHILPVYDVGSEGNLLYLVMRLVEGGSLDGKLRDGMLSVSQTARIFGQIASALNFAHDSGIVHRDLKPNNILLDSKGNPYLTDFGIAKMVQANTQVTAAGTVVGTPAYMAPEQWRAQEIDARTDIYALGIMLYEMLTGDLPFKADTPYGMMYQHLDTPIPRVSRPGVPNAINDVIAKATAKAKTERYPSAEMLADDVAAVLAGGTATNLHSVPQDDSRTFVSTASGATTRNVADGVSAKQVPVSTVAINAPVRRGSAPVLWIATIAVLLLSLGGGAYLITRRNADQINANATASEAAVALQNTDDSLNTAIAAATGTELARPTNTATSTPTATNTDLPTNTPVIVPTDVRFTDYTDLDTNIKFRYPLGWEVQKPASYAFFVTENYDALDFGGDIVTGAPYIQLIVGDARTFGVLDMSRASNPGDALVTFLGSDRVRNVDPVVGTNFPTVTTTRTRSAENVVRVTYMMYLGPDMFALAMLQTSPEISEEYNTNIVLPFVRSIDFLLPPTPAPEASPTWTPDPDAEFVVPRRFRTSTLNDQISIDVPIRWPTSIVDNALLVSSPNTTDFDPTDPTSSPYIWLQAVDAEYVNYVEGDSLTDIFKGSVVGAHAAESREFLTEDYPFIVGRMQTDPARGVGTAFGINGWSALVKLDENTFIIVYAQAVSSYENVFRDDLLLPMLRSIEYTPNG
jgi:serine/threonine protein kinase